MEEIKKVTLWYRKVQVEQGPGDIIEKWEFNHLEDGHVNLMLERPLPIRPGFKEQAREWRHGTWSKQHAYLINGKVVEKLPYNTVERGIDDEDD